MPTIRREPVGLTRLLGRALTLALLLTPAVPVGGIGTAPGDIAAFLVDMEGDVEAYQDQFSPSGRLLGKAWVALDIDDPLYIHDTLRAPPRGRAVIRFADRIEAIDAGPTIIHVGPDTMVKIASFEIDYDAARDQHRAKGLFDVIRGSIRSFIKGWGQRSTYSVRAGVAVCGLRGADATFDYRPEQEKLTVTVHEGAVVVAGPAGSKMRRRDDDLQSGRPARHPPTDPPLDARTRGRRSPGSFASDSPGATPQGLATISNIPVATTAPFTHTSTS